jgi:hypothetical protein
MYLYNKLVAGWLVSDHLMLRDFGPYGIIYMNVCCHNVCHGNSGKGFWALWDIYGYVCSPL